MATNLPRRDFLGLSLASGLAALGGLPARLLYAADGPPTSDHSPVAAAIPAPAPPRAETSAAPAEPFRFVHLTDIHVQPELRAADGFKQCLAKVAALDPKPDFIFTGGDLIMDAFVHDEQRAKLLFDLFKKIVADHTDLPWRYTIGNHDVFGWGLPHLSPRHVQYGKRMYLDAFELERTYYRFDHKGWRFFALDSIQPAPDHRYQGFIDDEQFEWLSGELQAKPPAMPACVVSHIPLLTITVFNRPAASESGFLVPFGMMCRNAYRMAQLLSQYNVRLALSGHIHEVDRVDFRRATYICDGAVCGSWWKGPNKGFSEGFGIVDLQPDGNLTHRYESYGWKAAPPETAPPEARPSASPTDHPVAPPETHPTMPLPAAQPPNAPSTIPAAALTPSAAARHA